MHDFHQLEWFIEQEIKFKPVDTADCFHPTRAVVYATKLILFIQIPLQERNLSSGCIQQWLIKTRERR